MTALTMAPNFTLTHVVGRPVSLGDFRGRPTVLIVTGRDSTDQARQITRTLRGRYGLDALPIASILDLSGIPKMMQGMAKGRIEGGYKDAVRDATAMMQQMGQQVPADPSQMVVMLPDWDGAVTASYGLKGVDKQAVAVAIDGNGYIRGYGTGAQGGEQILALFG